MSDLLQVNETHTLIQNTRQWLAVIDDVAEMVHKVERDVRQCADRAIDEVRLLPSFINVIVLS